MMRDPRLNPAAGDVLERMVGARRLRRAVVESYTPHGWPTQVRYTSTAGTSLICGLGAWRAWAKLADVVLAAAEPEEAP
ncbi:MAG: hypothetical protein C4558_06365 [Dehalococcoidia bacterium]|nr:MAG: hypothetical protein C4558_06365 [Dehalococcoidia bacterium]